MVTLPVFKILSRPFSFVDRTLGFESWDPGINSKIDRAGFE
jgi:hypothetical protein